MTGLPYVSEEPREEPEKAAPESPPMESGAVVYVIMDDELWRNGRRVRDPVEDW